MSGMIFGAWSELVRVLVVGTLAYIGMVLLLRAAGKRALTKMSAYDLVVTVALGSSLATALLSSQVTLDKAVLGFALLLALQRVVAWLSMRWRWFQNLVNNEPTLIVHRGRILHGAMRQENLTRDDIEAAVRSHGQAGLDHVDAVIVETDGSLSVISKLDTSLPQRLHRQLEKAAGDPVLHSDQ